MTAPGTAVERLDDLSIPVAGERVAASRYRPVEADGPLPALLSYTPYHKDDIATFAGSEPFLESLAAAGYEVVVADLVGTGASTGFKREPDTMVEGEEAATIVEWLADREWTTGAVGMFGKSYAATTSIKAAAEDPDGLAAIAPIHGPHTGYREAHEGGSFAFYRMGGDWCPFMHALAAKPPSRRDDAGEWADTWKARLDALPDADPWLFQYLDHRTRDEYWAEKDVDVGDLATPTFAVCGWRDAYARSTIEYYRGVDAPRRLLLGPWGHEMPHVAREAPIDFRAELLAWFDHFLKGADTGVRDEPEIVIWTGHDEPGVGDWRAIDAWPEADDAGEGATFAVAPDGLVPADAFADGAVAVEYEYDHTVGIDSLDGVYFSTDPVDTNADDARSLTYETPPLDAPREYTGTGRVDLRVSATTPDPMLVVRVVDVAPDGSATLVSHGELQASHRTGHDDPTPLDPGAEYTIPVPLTPTSHVFEAGHRIRVAVSTSYFPLTFPTRDHGTLTLRSSPDAPTRVVLPGRERETGGFDDAVSFDAPPETGPDPRLGPESATWTTARDHLADSATVELASEGTVELPHATMRRSDSVTASVQARDPTTARTTAEVVVELDYGHETVTVETTSRVARDLATLATTVAVDDDVIFEEVWRR